MIASLPVQRLTKSVGRPNYFTLKPLRQEIKENAASIYSLRGGGQHGHLGLVLSDIAYARESATPYIRALNPGVQPVLPANPTQYQIAEGVREHEEFQREWYEVDSFEKACRKQIAEAIEPPFLRGCRPAGATGLTTVPVRTILEHLFTNYGRLTDKEIEDNDTAFRKEWSTDDSFENIIVQIDDCAEMAETAGSPYSDAQILNNAYNLVQKTGMFTRDLIEWKRLPEADRTWVAFKPFMIARQIEQLEHAITAQGAGYHSANAALLENYNNTAEALTNLTTATASDCTALAALTNTVQQQTNQIKTKDEQIKTKDEQIKSKDELITSLKKQLIELRKTKGTTARDQGSYCWSHGFLVNPTHTSCTCKYKKPGHKDEATRTNTMGGNMKGDPNKK